MKSVEKERATRKFGHIIVDISRGAVSLGLRITVQPPLSGQ